MWLFKMFAIALPLIILESAQAAPIVQPETMPQSLMEPVRGCVAPYVSVGGRCVYAGDAYGGGVGCIAPYVSVGDQCVYGGYAYGGRHRHYRGYDDGYYGRVGCNAPYVSVGGRCVRAY